MKASDIKIMTDEEVGMALAETEKNLFHLRFQAATDRLETNSAIRLAKRDIARLQTEQRARQLAKLAAANVDQLTKLVDDLQTKTEGPGKRRVKRSLERVTRLHTAAVAKAPKVAATTAPKGK